MFCLVLYGQKFYKKGNFCLSMVRIYIERENKFEEISIKEKTEIKVLLDKLNISLSSIIISKNNEIVLEDEFVEDSDDLKLFSVVSGG